LIETWARTVPTEIEWPELPAAIADRDADVWEPLITCAVLVGGEWPARARAAALALIKVAHDAEPSLGLRLLEDMRDVFGSNTAMTTALILEKLLAMEEAPWGDIRGKSLDPRSLARLLKKYDIKPKVMRTGSGTVRGYDREDFAEAFECYLSPIPEKHVTAETAKHPPPNAQKNGTGGNGVSPVSLVTRSQGVGQARLGRPALGPGGDDDDMSHLK
jgi:hypothetical protein